MGEEELASGEGWISDDSSFYGDEDEQDRLLSLCEDLKPQPYWLTRKKDLNVIRAKQRTMPPPELFNHREGRHDSWQLGETVDDFIKRLPPLTTSRLSCEWIWVENPYRRSHGSYVSAKPGELRARGSELLAQSLQTRSDIQNKGPWKAKGQITRMLSQESSRLRQSISDLAGETNVLSGKWMLFPELEDLTRIWKLVVEGVINNRLGVGAKVAPDEGRPNARLICVYTKDYRDKEDVLRVLQELVSMGLAGTGRPIYYKSDAYTFLDIYGKNAAEYGLQTSTYSSQKMLSESRLPKSTPTGPRKQSTLNGFLQSCDAGEPMDLE